MSGAVRMRIGRISLDGIDMTQARAERVRELMVEALRDRMNGPDAPVIRRSPGVQATLEAGALVGRGAGDDRALAHRLAEAVAEAVGRSTDGSASSRRRGTHD